jgi:hypothetical protein
MFRFLKFTILIVMAVAVGFAGGALAQTTVEATAGWSPPTYGTPVEHYVLQHSVNDGAWATVGTTTDTLYTLTISYDDFHRVRVAGVDAEGRQGPFSLPSNSYNPSQTSPDGPAQPGQPVLF